MRWALLVVLVGCGGIAQSEFRDARLDAECEHYVRCGLFASSSDCRAYFDKLQIEDVSTPAAIKAGKISYDEDTAEACVEALAGLACDLTKQRPDTLDVCDDVYRGKGKQGEACAFDLECESDACSANSNCGMACCQGTCAPPRRQPTIGEPCTALCDDTAYCGTDEVCHALLPAGAACSDGGTCSFGLYCAGVETSGTGACAAMPRHGEACEGTCAEIGDRCLGGVCQNVGLPGDPCEDDAYCSSYYSCRGGVCGLYPALGEMCTGRCSGEAYCDAAMCVAQKPVGEGCTYNEECTTHYCDAGACAAPPLCT